MILFVSSEIRERDKTSEQNSLHPLPKRKIIKKKYALVDTEIEETYVKRL